MQQCLSAAKALPQNSISLRRSQRDLLGTLRVLRGQRGGAEPIVRTGLTRGIPYNTFTL